MSLIRQGALAICVDIYEQVGLNLTLPGEMGHHRRFACATVGYVETMALHSVVERLPISPTYWRPHLLHCMKWIMAPVVETTHRFNLKCSGVALLVSMFMIRSIWDSLVPSTLAVKVAQRIYCLIRSYVMYKFCTFSRAFACQWCSSVRRNHNVSITKKFSAKLHFK